MAAFLRRAAPAALIALLVFGLSVPKVLAEEEVPPKLPGPDASLPLRPRGWMLNVCARETTRTPSDDDPELDFMLASIRERGGTK